MRTATFIASLLGGLLLVSCGRTQSSALSTEDRPSVDTATNAPASRAQSSAPSTDERSLEQRVADLEQRVNGKAPQLSEADARKQYERDLAEIQSMGLVDLAQRDLSRRLTNATIEAWTIGYLMHSNTVWCDVRYRLPGGSEALRQEFGYTRKTGTNWSLIWGVGGEPR